ncbi:MAG TPA: hypothetical protein VGU45_00090 [Microvirga sp.]|nr:hypothetical protein [Microvirga sp.]
MALTGRFTFKRSLWGKIILQIEEEVRNSWPASRRTPFKKRWRNANTMDLTAPELRALMDLRFKPQYMAQYDHLAQDGEAAAARGREPAPVRPAEAEDRSVEVERVSRFGRPQRSA